MCYIDGISDYSTIALYMENPDLTPVLLGLIQKSSLPLKAIETDFAVDSSGFSTCRFDRWFSFKYGKEINSRLWVKAHVMTGIKTNIITAIKIGKAREADNPQFPELVNTTAENFEIGEISADKAYLSYNHMKLVDDLGGTAFIPFKENSVARARHPKLWKKMYHYFMLNREDFLQHYHKRSNIETTFHMIKAKFGDAVRSKTWTAQVNEVLLKVLCHNICVVIQEIHELGIEPNFAVEKRSEVLK